MHTHTLLVKVKGMYVTDVSSEALYVLGLVMTNVSSEALYVLVLDMVLH